ncbi:MAG: ThiF family adenylyltransferase [Gemmatimonadaceae bacterium]|nr:ThiF family adenylyltransferase [Gemmatimonadaceae bacterium]MCW5826342.1 ThiF family adenylyltransferase [Gemmatimonadaceae bacterium]
MQEELEPWVVGHGIERAIEGAEDWFRGYVSGVFANEVPAGELLAYLEPEAAFVRTVLIPGHALEHGGPSHGTLVLEWDKHSDEKPSLAIAGQRRWKGGKTSETVVRDENTKFWRSLRLDQNTVNANRFGNVEALWFRIEAEPTPFHDLAGFEEVLDTHLDIKREQWRAMAGQVLDKHARQRGFLPIVLEFKRCRRGASDHGPDYEWLVVSLEWPRLGKDVRRNPKLLGHEFWSKVELRGVPSYFVRPEDLRRRVGNRYASNEQARALAEARIVIVGVGALGSTVARSLAAMGAGNVVLVDPDSVSPGNVIRHEARFPDIGKAKVRAIRQVLMETNPHVAVSPQLGTRQADGSFDRMILDPSTVPALVIATVAIKAADSHIDDLARRAPRAIPVLHAWLMGEAQVLRAFVYRAGRTACLYCNGLFEKEQLDGRREWGYVGQPAGTSEPFYEASCTTPAFPGAGNSNALAAHIVVEMALDVVHDRLEDDQSHWVFAGNRICDVDPKYPVPPLTIDRRGFRPHPECPVCSGEAMGGGLSEEDQAEYDSALAAIPSK